MSNRGKAAKEYILRFGNKTFLFEYLECCDLKYPGQMPEHHASIVHLSYLFKITSTELYNTLKTMQKLGLIDKI